MQGINTGLAQQGQQYGQQYNNINQGMAQQGQQYGQQMGNLQNLMAQQAQQYGQGANNIGLNMSQYAQGLQGQNQAFSQGLQAAQFGLGQQNQAYNQAANNLGLGMQQQAQGFNQSGQNIAQNMAQQNQLWNQQMQGQGQYFDQSNAARQQAMQEAAYLRNMPLNELNALRTGAQVTNPTFQNYAQQSYTPGPDMMGAASNGYNAALNATNAQNAASGNFMSGLFDLGSAALGIPGLSDRRLKSDIVPLGSHRGHEWYEYTIFGRREIGVMAQEVLQTNPSAVHVHPSGFLMVDYGAL